MEGENTNGRRGEVDAVFVLHAPAYLAHAAIGRRFKRRWRQAAIVEVCFRRSLAKQERAERRIIGRERSRLVVGGLHHLARGILGTESRVQVAALHSKNVSSAACP